MGSMTESQEKKAIAITEKDNHFLDKYRYDNSITEEKLLKDLASSDEYGSSSEDELETIEARIWEKLQIIKDEYVKWYEILICLVFMVIGYQVPIWLLIFQKIMRQMDMENEVMQFQTIILMLMKIERVNVEMILEWLERYSNIFREPISKCVNNYEAGPWEALEAMKDDVTYQDFIRIIESLQSAVEKVPIREAFEELDSDRDYYKNKRKETNERLIKTKGMIGKVIGFAPMIILFVGYLIIPLVALGLMNMSSSMNTMQSMV